MAWTCPCGTNNRDDHASCRSCGIALFYPQRPPDSRYQASPPNPQRKLPQFIRVVFVIGAIIFLISIFSDLNKPSGPRAISTTVEPSPKAPQARSPDPAYVGSGGTSVGEPLPQYPIGQEFSVGYFTYRVDKVESKSTPDHGPLLAVDVTVRNNDDTGTGTPQLRLLDEDGKDYGGTVLELATPSGNLLTELQPGVVHRGYAAFDVPNDRPYVLRVSGGMTSGKEALVKLTADARTKNSADSTGNVGGRANFPPATPELIMQARTAIDNGRRLCISTNQGSAYGDLSYCADPCSPRSLKLFNAYGMDAVERACSFLKSNGISP